MKKIYLKPEIENVIMKNSWNLCSGSFGTGNPADDPGAGSGIPVVPAPQRPTPAF